MENNVKEKNSHASAALVLGIVGLSFAIIMVVLFGVIGGVIAVVLGVLALDQASKARIETDNKSGNGGLVTGILAIVFSVILSLGMVGVSIAAGHIAEDRGYPMIAKHARTLIYGAIPMAYSIAKDEDDLDKFKDELDRLKDGIR